MEEDLRELEWISELIEYDDLTSGSVSWIDREDFLAVGWFRHEEITKIDLESSDGFVFCLLGEDSTDLGLDRLEEGSVSLLDGFFELGDESRSGECMSYEIITLIIFFDLDREDPELLSASEGESLVGLDTRDEDVEVGVNIELLHFATVFFIQFFQHFLTFDLGRNHPTSHEMSALRFSDNRIGTDLCCDDLDRTFEDLFASIFCEEGFGDDERSVELDRVGDHLESLLDGEHGLGFLLEAVGCVDVFDFFECLRKLDVGAEFWGERTLFFDPGEGGEFGFVEVLFLFAKIDDGADLVLVKIPGTLFAITGDKWNGCTFGYEIEDCGDLWGTKCEFVLDDLKVVGFLHGVFDRSGLYEFCAFCIYCAQLYKGKIKENYLFRHKV